MKTNPILHYCLLVLLLLAGCQSGALKKQESPQEQNNAESSATQQVKKYTIEQLMSNLKIGGSSFSPDEKTVLFSSNQTGIFNVFEVPVTGGEVKQVTDSKSNEAFLVSYFPQDERILFSSDQGGDENTHIYLREKNGNTRDLTPYKGAKSEFLEWSFDENSFFFTSNKRNPKFFDLYEMDNHSLTPKLIYQNDQGFTIADVSNDKKQIALMKSITTNNSDMYVYNLATKQLKHLSKHEGDVQYMPLQFAPNNEQLYYLTNEKGEFMSLNAYNLATHKTAIVEQPDWDVSWAFLSRNGKYRVMAINNDGRTEIKVYDMHAKKPVKLPQLPSGDISSVNISRSENLMTFYVNSSKSPNSLYVYDFNTGQYKELVNAMSEEINPEDLVAGEVIRYQSFDGLEIPAILYKPHGAEKGPKHPAVLMIHGGPGGQSRLGYSPLVQYLVNHGYVVLAVNNRGSSGYGKTFFAADDRKHGDVDLKDCIESKKFLASTGYVDEEKIGIMGGSYGGYMVLAALAFAPEEFAVGVDIFGVANWLRTLNSIPPYWESFREALYNEMGHPQKDSVALYNKSPLFHAANIKKPLMVLQGANDPRVLKVESDEIVEAVKKNNVPVEYIIFPDEGHGFLKKENEIKGYSAILSFLDKYLAQKHS